LHPRHLALVALLALPGLAQDAPPDGPGTPPADAPPAAVTPSPIEALEAWLQRFSAMREFWTGAELEYERLLRDVRPALERGPAEMQRGGGLLLDLAGYQLDDVPRMAHFAGSRPHQRVRRRAFAQLSDALEDDVGKPLLQWLADDVLLMPGRHSMARRYVALYLTARNKTDAGRMALLSVARDEADALRPAVLEAMTAWPDDAIDLFLVGLIGKKFDKRARPHPFNVLLKRVRNVDVPLGARASGMLEVRAQAMLISTDWREASRAIELARGLDAERRVPLLIDALSAWDRRGKMGTGSRRILDDIVLELREISGRSIGTNPKNWITWWIAVRQGQTPLHVADAEEGQEARSSATFFGLRPVTDRVTFIIDISGSMEARWATQEHSRYQEAIEQMTRFLQAIGEDARFNVILFSGAPLRSSPHLVPASTETLAKARNSLLARAPGGGTYLRPAVERALRLDKHGDMDIERLEADSIIVLCDGETTDGPAWVRPLLDRIGTESRIRFHCVLIGNQDDGTLAQLAAGTGGDYVRVGQ
jgi:Mg-chelatase subunit ChlD